ncbi:hypothetical protein QCB52_03440 [Myroides odoratimimus]
MKKLLGKIMLGITGWKYAPNNFDPKKKGRLYLSAFLILLTGTSTTH